MKKIGMTIVLSLFMLSASAVEKPTAAEVKKVLDFYYQGQGQGVVLIESMFCREVATSGENKNECIDPPLSNTSISKGETVNLWMAYMIPNKDEKQNIIIQFEQGSITRMVKDIQLGGSFRYRTWRKVKLNRAGEWTIKIILDQGNNSSLLATRKLTVSEAKPEAKPSAAK